MEAPKERLPRLFFTLAEPGLTFRTAAESTRASSVASTPKACVGTDTWLASRAGYEVAAHAC